jgi:hypothetical protein
LLARIKLSRFWVAIQLPNMVSVRVTVSGLGGTGYISAVSIKLIPWTIKFFSNPPIKHFRNKALSKTVSLVYDCYNDVEKVFKCSDILCTALKISNFNCLLFRKKQIHLLHKHTVNSHHRMRRFHLLHKHIESSCHHMKHFH